MREKLFPVIPERVLAAQARAADPERNVWLSANAGSGKTHVLTERVIRLLLAGANPARIVCLTYTKAAAAVMQTRIFNRLSQWTAMDDERLTEELRHLERHTPQQGKIDACRLASARRLFARALETPGGLKIQTVHAFCEAILHQFPVEANIAGHFDMLDDLTAQALSHEARRQLIETAWRGEDQELTQAFNEVLARVGEFGLNALLGETLPKREALKASLAQFKRRGRALFYPCFGLEAGDDAETLAQQLKAAALFPDDIMVPLDAHGGKGARDFVATLRRLKAEIDWQNFLPLVLAAYYDAKGEKPISGKSILVKAVQQNMPEMAAHLAARQSQVTAIIDKIRALELARLNEAAYHLMAALVENYEALKRARGLLDFDDLIHRTLTLLRRKGAGAWVHYKLDRGIEHILVDEAQDTAQAQWQIIRILTDEFFSGHGAQTGARTIFAVGDEKQSIYSFQGARPEDFAENGVALKKKSRAALKLFDTLRLDFSFRSTPDVLGAVDEVFSSEANYQGLSADNVKTVHQAIRRDEPGEVMIWQALAAQESEEPEDWRESVDHTASPPLILARQIAETIDNWLWRGEVLVGQGRLLRPGDIMVLVRSRDSFVHALARELKNRAIAVAGSDRLRLNDHIAIRDLMALARVCLQPVDDLSLACLLKSPLFGLDEDALFELATRREKGELLFQALHRLSEDNPDYGLCFTALQRYRALADSVPVYEFYSRILSEDGGRRKILARLGSEASDVLDAFMDYTLAMQQNGLPGLQAFIETLATSAPEIKREMDQARDEVRIMTVHAAKGLEAAVVFLVDGGKQIWTANRAPKLLSLPKQAGKVGEGTLMVWNPAKDYHIGAVSAALEAIKVREAEEYRRLLYVGMTRAEDRLIVCGYKSKKTPAGCWLELVSGALVDQMQPVEPPPARDVIAHCYQQTVNQLALREAEALPVSPPALPPPPTLLFEKMAAEPTSPRPLAPSRAAHLIDDETPEQPKHLLSSPVLAATETAPNIAIARGTLIHRLLQYLPDVAPAQRGQVARAFIARQTPDWSPLLRQDIEIQINNLLADERLSRLFDRRARAEVPLMGTLTIGGKTRVISGQIDRLAIFDDEILFADFKTGQLPQNEASIAESYLLQMALYRQLLRSIYPDRPCQALLIYSQSAPPAIFPLDGEKLDHLYGKL